MKQELWNSYTLFFLSYGYFWFLDTSTCIPLTLFSFSPNLGTYYLCIPYIFFYCICDFVLLLASNIFWHVDQMNNDIWYAAVLNIELFELLSI